MYWDPDLAVQLSRLEIIGELFCTAWLITLFADVLPMQGRGWTYPVSCHSHFCVHLQSHSSFCCVRVVVSVIVPLRSICHPYNAHARSGVDIFSPLPQSLLRAGPCQRHSFSEACHPYNAHARSALSGRFRFRISSMPLLILLVVRADVLQLWDALMLADASLVMCFAAAVVLQLRHEIMEASTQAAALVTFSRLNAEVRMRAIFSQDL
jgi:hypothetical protein